jgi:hypothetical protein
MDRELVSQTITTWPSGPVTPGQKMSISSTACTIRLCVIVLVTGIPADLFVLVHHSLRRDRQDLTRQQSPGAAP